VLNPVLGIGEKGSRIIVKHCATPAQMVSAFQCVADMKHEVLNAAYLPSRRGGERDLLLHIEAEDAGPLIQCMKTKGIEAEERPR
jgi:hypothetical protein